MILLIKNNFNLQIASILFLCLPLQTTIILSHKESFQKKIKILTQNSFCELSKIDNLKINCQNISKKKKNQIVLSLVNCYLMNLNQIPLCTNKLMNLEECLSSLFGTDLLIFTEFYKGFEESCQYFILIQELSLKKKFVNSLEEILFQLFNQMYQ